VLLTGANFQNATAVKFNGANAAFSVTASSQIQAVVPPAATSGFVTVVSPSGTSTNAIPFFVPPRLTSFTPTSGVVGTPVTLSGTNFVGSVEAFIGGYPVPVVVNSSNTLTATIVEDTRSGWVAVRTLGGVIISTNEFRVLPKISSFAPGVGPVGTPVTISGASFHDVQSVAFNGIATTFTNQSSSEILTTVPARATTGVIQVTTLDGTAASTNSFLVTAASDVAVNSTVSPHSGPPGQLFGFVLRVFNAGPSTVSGVVITNTLPAGAVLVSASSPRGPCAALNGVITCDLGLLTNSTAVEIAIQAQINTEGVFTNRVNVHANEPDALASNNSASSTVVVVSTASATLQIDQAANANQAVISWPVSPVGFVLQSLPSLSGANDWTTASPPPVTVSGRHRVTNEVTGTSRFYRLERE